MPISARCIISASVMLLKIGKEIHHLSLFFLWMLQFFVYQLPEEVNWGNWNTAKKIFLKGVS
jgi:hypothetical protein